METRITFKEKILAHKFCADLFEHFGLCATRHGNRVTFTAHTVFEYDAFIAVMQGYKTDIFDNTLNR